MAATRTHDLTAQVDGVRVLFTLSETMIAGTLVVYLNPTLEGDLIGS